MNKPDGCLGREAIEGLEDLPAIVLTDNMFSRLSTLVRLHQGGVWSHAMLMHRRGFVSSQEGLLRERPIGDFLTGEHYVKIWRPKWVEGCKRVDQGLCGAFLCAEAEENREADWEKRQRAVMAKAAEDLRGRWWKRYYDALGIVGQKVGARWIQWPWAKYCSERVGEYAQMLDPRFGLVRPSPTDINRRCEELGWEMVGRWWPDEKI